MTQACLYFCEFRLFKVTTGWEHRCRAKAGCARISEVRLGQVGKLENNLMNSYYLISNPCVKLENSSAPSQMIMLLGKAYFPV